MALMLMVLDDEDIKHPPVECVFTTEEEVGLNGAKALDKSLISARTMINMDSEDEGIATVSCAGGLRVECVRPIRRETAEGTLIQIEISGLLGGHSGMDINKERQNANILMGRMLHSLMKETDGKLVNVAGGSKDNAIPRECMASLLYTEASEAEKAEELSCRLAETFAEELSSDEPDSPARRQWKKAHQQMSFLTKTQRLLSEHCIWRRTECRRETLKWTVLW